MANILISRYSVEHQKNIRENYKTEEHDGLEIVNSIPGPGSVLGVYINEVSNN